MKWPDPTTLILLLIGTLVAGGVMVTLIAALRCAISYRPECLDLNLRGWITDAIVVLMAFLIRNNKGE